MNFSYLSKEIVNLNKGPSKAEVVAIDQNGNSYPLELKRDNKGRPYFSIVLEEPTEVKVDIPDVDFYTQMKNFCGNSNIINHVLYGLKGWGIMCCPEKNISWVQGPIEDEEFCATLNAGAEYKISSSNPNFNKFYDDIHKIVEDYIKDKKLA